MSISDPQYLDWLKKDGTSRALLIEADSYSGGVTTHYMSNRSYRTKPGDVPPNQPYDDIVSVMPAFTANLSELFTGASIPSYGDVDITNESGVRDVWVTYAWDGRPIRVYLGDHMDLNWRKGDFRLLVSGTVQDIITKDGGTILSLRMRDKTGLLNVPIQTTLVGGTTANKDRPVPLTFGQCYNIEALLIDAATHKYQPHDGNTEDVVSVREGGNNTGFTEQLSAGTFTLTGSPTLSIKCDVKGAKPSGVYLTKCADIIQHIITTRTQLTIADVDTANFTAFNTTCPQTLGLYVGDRRNVIDVLDDLVTSLGGFWTFSRTGLLQLGRLEDPVGATSVLDFGPDDIPVRSMRIVGRQIPISQYLLGYKRNWSPQADGLAGSVVEADRAAFAADYLISKAVDASVETAHLLARKPERVGTLLVDPTESATETARRLALWGVIRTTYEVDTYMAPFSLNLGQVVRITHPRYGFQAGVKAVVVGISEYPTRGRARLTVWK